MSPASGAPVVAVTADALEESGRCGRGRCGSVVGGGGGGGGGGPWRGTPVGSSVSKDSCFLRIPRRFASGLAVAASFRDVIVTSLFDVDGVDGNSELVVVVLVLRMLLMTGERGVMAAVEVVVFASSGTEVS